MAESFVKTFKRASAQAHKRDVYLNKLESAAMVPAQLGTWFDDYNDTTTTTKVHPHNDLKMLSPREYLRSSATR